VAEIRETITANKQGSHRFHVERFSLKKLNVVKGKQHYHVEVSNRFAALEDLNAKVDINSALEAVGEVIKITAKESVDYYELKRHKPRFDEGCS
jgi:hypothetical protein